MSIRSWLMARFYDRVMSASEAGSLGSWRAELLGSLSGEILEIGAGTGVNLEYFSADVTLSLAEPEAHMRRQLEARVRGCFGQRITVSDWSAGSLNVPDGSFDYTVSTLVLCSVDDPLAVLSELHRVLRPGGALVFIEHVAARGDPTLALWQRRWEPIWKHFTGNCHLTRDTGATIAASGFELEQIKYDINVEAPGIVKPVVWGVARRQDPGPASTSP